jgi:hypothetical protein
MVFILEMRFSIQFSYFPYSLNAYEHDVGNTVQNYSNGTHDDHIYHDLGGNFGSEIRS